MANAPQDFDGLIENFLGPEICNNDIVLGCKLTEREASNLDLDLTIGELDEAAGTGKIRSAPGIDGFNNFFIKKFWKHFRIPLHNYATTCFRKKTLTDSFRTATIKLIPKKGDCRQLKNWRPISLLNCFYKVISRAINNRLKKFNDRFTSRAQTGFTTSRFLQEVILNVAQSTSYCNNNNISGAVVSVDLSKAFDTILHGFVRASYKFFGVNNKFLDMMDTLGTNRLSRIGFDDNTFSQPIPLGTGRPQGDCPSPLQFNVGNQILLFKCELDPLIKSIYANANVPRAIFPVDRENLPVNFRYESNAETDKVDGLADDTTISILMDIQSLDRLKNILAEFTVISGLKCNLDKTCVLPIGPATDAVNEIPRLGFIVVERFKLLGFNITREGPETESTFEGLYQKIANLITVWDRYRLSLAGRIGIYKTLLLSQLSFHGSILRPSSNMVVRLQNLMNRFVIGTLKIAANRLYLDPDSGGLGLINIDTYLSGLHCAWIKKAAASTRDNWRIDLRTITGGNCFSASSKSNGITQSSSLLTLATDFEIFTKQFYKFQDNYKEAYIWENSFFANGQDRNLVKNITISGNRPMLDPGRVSKLRYKDLFSEDGPKSLDKVVHDTGINFNLVTYMRLMDCFRDFRLRRRVDTGKSESITQFFSIKKGEAKKVRKFLDARQSKVKSVNDLCTTKTFIRLTELNETPLFYGKIAGFWLKNFLPNKVREFCFKFYNNQLPLNTRLSHFLPNMTRGCTFCAINRMDPVPDEDFMHLFYRCPTTSIIHNWFNNRYKFLPEAENDDIRRRLFFLGSTEVWNEASTLITVVIQFLIWEMKTNKKIVSGTSLDIDFRFLIKNCFRNCRRLTQSKDKLRQELKQNLFWIEGGN
jgi:hypothetical protein